MKSKKDSLHRAIRQGWIIALIALAVTASAYLITGLIAPNRKANDAPREATTPISTHLPFSGRLHFNNEVGESDALDIIREQIDRASHSLEIAVFSFTSTELRDALYSAARRGVRVSVVIDASLSERYGQLWEHMPKRMSLTQGGTHDPEQSIGTTYMHHKFIIADRGHPGESLITGSLNFTPLGEKYNQSFMLETSDEHLIDAYGAEFERLESGASGTEKLGIASYRPLASTIEYPNGTMEVWFSPGDASESVRDRVVNLIRSSQKSIDIMMWTLTDQGIATALIERARQGVMVRIITGSRTAETEHSAIPLLAAARDGEALSTIEILTDKKLAEGARGEIPEGIVPYIHHHSMVVDDAVLVTGSGNWSLWGFTRNDENHIVTNIPSLIQGFRDTFGYFHKKLK
jgi:phosphatidylserine/phosphatidylglycerophosphate/cardiolipin synthase-like enzyme